ncbi:ABC transporter ATP-binding protein [Streptomyces sp. ACA25]|uniref:ABC transporter ATP-binding protein n=1 Tax=Streptomyces sp. ACA25 TaxID=3022596 RepID=UPI002307B68C|nr:ABC transporter ATP-binding protein [Streptomyces sp. ACA25]MDB1089004.1 ABC transporter ATP-binding protein [Streptomyces sp. ACA25]
MTELQIRGLTKAYGPGEPVLDGVDLEISAGELAAVLGPSGCGKTTLLRVVAGFLPADRGTVTVGGRVVSGPGVHLPPERRAIGLVAQEGALFPHLSVRRNVAFGLHGLRRAERRFRAEEMLELVGLAGFGERMPHELSGGQQQRVSLARALAPRPALVLLDEPFNALDSALRTGLRADVRTALRATGATAVLVTHDQQEALSTADRIAVLRGGRVAQCGTPQEVYSHPADAWVARFVGDAVLLPGRVEGTAASTALGRIQLVGGVTDGRGTVVLRPEQLLLSEPGRSAIRGRVADVCFYGHDAVVSVAVDGMEGTVDVRHPGPVLVRPGEETGLTVTGRAVLHPGAVA